jgi:hypothetical protein
LAFASVLQLDFRKPGHDASDHVAYRPAQIDLLRHRHNAHTALAPIGQQVDAKVQQAYQKRAAAEESFELRRHPPALRITLLAVYCRRRMEALTDTLVELLINQIQRIGARAERKVEKELLADFKRVSGKTGMLFRLTEASLGQPEGVVSDVIFPVVSEERLQAIVKEWRSTAAGWGSARDTCEFSSLRAACADRRRPGMARWREIHHI